MKLEAWMVVLCLAALPVAALADRSMANGPAKCPADADRQQVTLTLKADGGKLTGSAAGGRGGEIPIEEEPSRTGC